MDNNFIRKFPRLFSSSFTLCQSRNEAKTTQILQQNGKSLKPSSRIHADSHLNHLIKSKSIKNAQNMSHADQSKPIKNHQSMSDVDQRVVGNSIDSKMNSSSSNSLFFSSEETGTFCSFSTASAESFRIMKLAETKKLTGRCSSELSLRSNGSIVPTEQTQKTEKVAENRAFCPNKSKTKEKNKEKNWAFQEAYGMPSELYYKKNKKRRHKKSKDSCVQQGRGRGGGRRRGEIGLCSIVVKSSSDPYRDFRASIVEMMLENQIFGAQDLQKLLHCLLSLNLPCFHKVIVDVFSEICQPLYAV